MIADTLDSLKGALYPEAFRKAFDFLKNLPPDAADGTYPIDGKKIYAMVQSGTTCGTEADKLEIHRKFIDIQYLISGRETLVWAPMKGLDVHTPYNGEKDFCFLLPPGNVSRLDLLPGAFAVFFPGDAHNGKLSGPAGDTAFRKVVVKIDASLI